MQKPTIQQVQSYCDERQNRISAEAFIDYYESVGWMIGKKPMKNWQAAVRTWERNQRGVVNAAHKPVSRSEKATEAHRNYRAELERQAEIEACGYVADIAQQALGF